MISQRVLVEATVVGLITAICLVLKNYVHTDRGPLDTLVSGFAVGVVIHILFELTGGNAWYCTHGAACSS